MDEEGKESKDFKDSPWYALARYMGVGMEVAIAIVVSLYAGYKLDHKFGTSPVFLIVSLAVGFAVMINILLYYSRAADKDTEGKK